MSDKSPDPLSAWDAQAWPLVRESLAAGATLITANNRLARYLLEAYADWQQEQGRSVWPRADILPWTAWGRRVLESSLDDEAPRLLNDAQSERLWRHAITLHQDVENELEYQARPAQCVRPAMEAWALLQAHCVGESALAHQPDLEARVLARWVAAYRGLLEERRAIDRHVLVDWLKSAFATGQRPVPGHLVVAGFHELPPAVAGLLQTLDGQACLVQALQQPRQNDSTKLLHAADATEEVWIAAHWARARLEANPRARIGIVVLDLNERRALLERIFSEVLMPPSAYQTHHESAYPFNISLGWPLAEEPIIHDALLALKWVTGAQEFSAVSRLLRSPFFHFKQAAMAALELRLRELNLSRPSVDEALYQAGGRHRTPWRNAHFAAQWRQFRNTLRLSQSRQSPLQWASVIGLALDALGWGQGRKLNSREHQAMNAWHDCLEQFANLHVVLPQCDLSQAVAEIRQLATRQIYQPSYKPAPVLITQPLQALGMAFDHVWLMGLSDELWPEPARPNPLIPHDLQRRYRMAHASAAGELRYAQTISEWLLASAPEVVASWPRLSGDKSLRPSPLLRGLLKPDERTAVDANQALQQWAINAFTLDEGMAAAGVESYRDEQAPPPAPGGIGGGAGILREQSACPFRALALHHWGLNAAQPVSGGLNPRQRGILIHRALQLAYEQSDGELPPLAAISDLAAHSVEQTLTDLRPKIPLLADQRVHQAESQRLRRAVAEWLSLDHQRPSSFRVTRIEDPRRLRLGELEMNLRVDRLDHLENGGVVLIDYKGGQAHGESEWFGPRPRDPQLPVYALALADDETLTGLLFGNLQPGKRGYRGLTSEAGLVQGATTLQKSRASPYREWPALLEYWRQQLTLLADDFMAGRAAADPRDANVCRLCSLTPLCRIRDLRHEALNDRMEESGPIEQGGASP